MDTSDRGCQTHTEVKGLLHGSELHVSVKFAKVNVAQSEVPTGSAPQNIRSADLSRPGWES